MKHIIKLMLTTALFGLCVASVSAADTGPKSPIGKVITGYQGWFATPGEDVPTSSWIHWASGLPRLNNTTFEMYPDISEYDANTLAQTGFANFGDGRKARLFSSYYESVIDLHAKWMKEYEIDGVALQRFMTNEVGLGRHRDSVIVRMLRAAEKYDRIAYVMYDMSADNPQQFKLDWLKLRITMKVTEYSSYAHVDGKPVVCIWGFGFNNRSCIPTPSLEIINWLKSPEGGNCYVIGGVPRNWDQNEGCSGYANVYAAFDMISPWFVGSISGRNDALPDFSGYRSIIRRHRDLCGGRGQDYQPVAYPGFAWSQLKTMSNAYINEQPRRAGGLAWGQAYEVKDAGIPNLYLAMFDEYDECTAWMKNASDWSDSPTDQFTQTASIDGWWLSTDFQLRVAQAISRMQKGTIATTSTMPVPHSLGPVYYRNSFERRYTQWGPGSYTTANLDPCFRNDAESSNSNVANRGAAILIDTDANAIPPKSGKYLARFSGTASGSSSSYYHKFGEARILIEEDVTLTFWKYAKGEQGLHTTLSLRFSDGTYLHNLTTITDKAGIGVSPENPRGTVGEWTKHEIVLGQGDLIGKTITELVFAYAGTGSGSIETFFDDILIAHPSYTPLIEHVITVSVGAEGGAVSGGNTYRHGESVTVTATPSTNYEFKNWTINGIEVPGAEATYSFAAEEALDLVANFGLPSGTKTAVNDGAIVATEYYNVQGIRIASPQAGGIYIVKIIYESGITKAVKQIIK